MSGKLGTKTEERSKSIIFSGNIVIIFVCKDFLPHTRRMTIFDVLAENYAKKVKVLTSFVEKRLRKLPNIGVKVVTAILDQKRCKKRVVRRDG